MIQITKDTIIGDILDIAPQTAPVFMSIGMHCLGCPSSRGETVEEACAVHGTDADELVKKINEFLAKNAKSSHKNQQIEKKPKTKASLKFSALQMEDKTGNTCNLALSINELILPIILGKLISKELISKEAPKYEYIAGRLLSYKINNEIIIAIIE